MQHDNNGFTRSHQLNFKQEAEIMPEEQLWRQFKQGNEEAYAWMYNTYFFVLFNYGRQFCSHKDHVKDCIQDLFVELWEKKERLGDTDSIKYYLLKCLRRKITKKVSEPLHSSVYSGEIASESFPVALPLEYQIIEELEEREREHKLRQAVNALTPQQREVIFLTFYENLSQEQVASVLSVEIKTVRNLLWKSIKTLRSLLSTLNFHLFIIAVFDQAHLLIK